MIFWSSKTEDKPTHVFSIIYLSIHLFSSLFREFQAMLYLNGSLSHHHLCSAYIYLIIIFVLLYICVHQLSQNLFLIDVGIFIVYVRCATQTRSRFYIPPNDDNVTTFSDTHCHSCVIAWLGIEPWWLLWEAAGLELLKSTLTQNPRTQLIFVFFFALKYIWIQQC